ncbi:unnamed protein product [marine sediment metagenome]|uniref:RNA polymerase alpha subunit C-terminal domain-containing protein n=1 Tax=marine sediment metagenome TaxID=412755 RepID=X1SSM2_9ZZZZ
MQAVIYLGPLRIARTKYGQFARGKRADLEDVVAREVLKLPGFEEPTFLGRYIGRVASRSLKVQGAKIIVCPKGIWTALPVTIKYKINADPDFELGPSGVSAKSLITKQKEDIARKIRIAKKMKHRQAPAPVAVVKPEVKVEPEVPSSIESLNLPARIVSSLKDADIYTVADLPKGRKLLEIKGIGMPSARIIREVTKED